MNIRLYKYKNKDSYLHVTLPSNGGLYDVYETFVKWQGTYTVVGGNHTIITERRLAEETELVKLHDCPEYIQKHLERYQAREKAQLMRRLKETNAK